MNLDDLAKKYGGSPVQSGSSKFDELAQKYGGIAVEGGPEEPKKDTGRAPFSLSDIAASFGMGAVGSTKALTDVAGAENAASSKLGEASKALQSSLTPERQAELQRQQERMKSAEKEGTLAEVKAAVQNIAEAPLQSIAQGVGSFVPYLPAMFAAPAAAALRLAMSSFFATLSEA